MPNRNLSNTFSVSHSSPAGALAKNTFLIIEDDACLREIVGEVSIEADLTPLLAADMGEALALLEGLPAESWPVGMILDIGLPDGSSENLPRLIEERFQKVIPTLVFTGLLSDSQRRRVSARYYRGLIEKPCSYATLLSFLRCFSRPSRCVESGLRFFTPPTEGLSGAQPLAV